MSSMDILPSLLLCVVVIGFYLPGTQSKVCYGTSNGLSHQGDAQHRYVALRRQYENCTFVDGNVELVYLNDQDDYDLSFLKDIKVITGYMIIYQVMARVIPMTNLRIIRGRTLYLESQQSQNQYSLYVVNNYRNNSNAVGLHKLQFTALREILAGDIGFVHNNLLCHDNTIHWTDIAIGENARIILKDGKNEKKRTCPACHEACEEHEGSQYCWGPTEGECQELTRVVCARQCESRCYGRLPNECCNAECAGGCKGPTRNDCWACQNFEDDGECVPYCPPPLIYDDKEFKNVQNPNMKYTYGNLCVDECPSYLVMDSGACVKECASGKHPVNNSCVDCGDKCSTSCTGFNHFEDYLTSQNIDKFRNCTVINGNLQILQVSIDGEPGIPPLSPADLEIFKSIRTINGFLSLECHSPELHDASFLSNLETVSGRMLYRSQYAVSIHGTSFRSLGLKSLKTIMNGNFLLYQNRDLCYTASTNYTLLFKKPGEQKVHTGDNRQQDKCRNNRFVCDEECSQGCWSLGPDQCLRCHNYLLNETCVATCETSQGFVTTANKTCSYCHPECNFTCYGPGSEHCHHCKHVKDGPYCIPKCPISKYPDHRNVCQPCARYCSKGCTGPNNTVGPAACNSCERVKVHNAENTAEGLVIEKCLNPDEVTCTPGYTRSVISSELNSTLAGKSSCQRCHRLCRTCYGPGPGNCEECQFYKQEMACVDRCSNDRYLDQLTANCLPCHPQCSGCYGPSASECTSCRLYQLMEDEPDDDDMPSHERRFNCTDQCPSGMKPAGKTVNGTTAYICTPEILIGALQDKAKGTTIAGVIVGFIIFAVIVIIFLVWRLKLKRDEKMIKLAQKFTGVEESEPLTPTNASPDMSVLRLAKESELRKGTIIGSGAFGTVFKGMWVPENENVKIPVAIKVLQESTSPSQNQELLEEARVMASVDHPYCVRILAVCMTAQMMLITQLMPLGCLLDYVRKNKTNIGSKVLLNWCTQIARGMIYLEERGIVHRDLAARNVLVQNPSTVKITDFGLAKLLDYNEDEYRSSGGKMPIKWLALECIQHRIFTHKSDVWSYGVTVWELFTYGQKPYDNIRARDVPDLLEKGERLSQPTICTIDVYMIMIKCWMLDAQSRPTFRELAEEFSKMARDPGRYLVIDGDKLMRLPSTVGNKEDFLHSLSIADEGPEKLMEAEDYLQPTSTYNPGVPKITPGTDSRRGEGSYDNDRDLAAADALQPSCSAQGYPHTGKAAAGNPGAPGNPGSYKMNGKVPRSSSVSSRYSPDPCKILGDPKDLSPDLSPGTPGLPQLSDGEEDVFEKRRGKVPLPVIDEDDYLQPKSSNPAAYMDLIDGKDYMEPSIQDNQYLEPTSVDNPEYYLQQQQQQQQPQQQHRQPPPSSFSQQSLDSELGIDSLKSHKDPPRLRSPSTDSNTSSDPDYYNEFDKLNHKQNRPVPAMRQRIGETIV